MRVGGGTVVITGFFGTIVAWVMVRHTFPGKGLLNAFIDLPFAVSPVIAGYMLILLFGLGGWFTPLTDGRASRSPLPSPACCW